MSLHKLSAVLGTLLGMFVVGIVLVEAEIAVAQQPETPEEPDMPDIPCPEFCGPSDFYRYLEQLAAWFVEVFESA